MIPGSTDNLESITLPINILVLLCHTIMWFAFQHSMDVYSKRIIRGYLNKDPKYEIPPKQSKPPQPVPALKPDVTSVDLINHGSELDLVVEGSNLWFYNKLSMYDKRIEPAPSVQQNIGTCLHVKISGKSNSNLKSLKDGQKVTIGFFTHFTSHWPIDVECHTKVSSSLAVST